MPHDAVAQKHFTYAALNLIWHCRNTPLSAFAQVQKEILDFSLLRPGSCFANAGPGECLIFYVPTFLSFIKTLVCFNFFARSHILNTRRSPSQMPMKSTVVILGWFSISSHLNFTPIIQALD